MSGHPAATTALPADTPLAALLDGLFIHLQPIIDVASGAALAWEALARFGTESRRPADEVIADAHLAGYGDVLEAACVRAALRRRDALPDGVFLAVNISPDMLARPLVERGWPADLDGVIVEVTEHRASDPVTLQDNVADLRRRGARIAVDDVGTGYAGLLRLATMRPDIVKIDRTVVTGVLCNDAQGAVLEALVTFSHRMNASVIGEGVEALDDITALARFDVDYGQGFAIGRPAATPTPINPLVVAACHEARAQVLQRRHSSSASTARSDGLHSVVSIMMNATGLADLHSAAAEAALALDVDAIGVSTIGLDGRLREITAVGAEIDTQAYDVSNYPLTDAVLNTGQTVEVHVNDVDADPAELRVLRELNQASLLMVPLLVDGRPIGVLELAHRTHRRWNTQDITHAHGLAAHLSKTLSRING